MLKASATGSYLLGSPAVGKLKVIDHDWRSDAWLASRRLLVNTTVLFAPTIPVHRHN